MEFIQNSGDGTRLEQLNAAAVPKAESVIAAVAYVTDTRTLLDSCLKHQKPLTLFARYDFSGPVSDQVLQWFLDVSAKSANYQMRLIGDIFHPKVIWWKGVGVYIGSANLTKSAWAGNVEAGIYLSEEEFDENNMRSDIECFFAQVQVLSHSLTREIADQMIASGSGAMAEAQGKAENQFEKNRLIPRQHSLVSITRQPATTKHRSAFLKEWSETLQYLRDIGQRIAQPENRPDWVAANASPGVLADQFLHAYYYNQVRDGATYPYRELFKANTHRREAALQGAIEWWRELKFAPSSEDVHISSWAPDVRLKLENSSLLSMTLPAFKELCLRVHAVRDHARRVSSTAIGLQAGMNSLVQDDRIRAFAEWLFAQISKDGSTCCEVISYVLYGGSKSDIPDRIFTACHDPTKKISHMGISTLGEMVGWAMPDDFPPRNGRTSKALTALGYQVTIHSE